MAKASQSSTIKSESASTRVVSMEIENNDVEFFGSSNPLQKIKKKSKTLKAGLTLPVSRIERYLRKGNYANRVGPGEFYWIFFIT